MSNNCPTVSVIIPIFNVESYIERCVHSLFKQTLQDIEFIFINDATLDKSIEILKETLIQYPHRQAQVKIINHEHNLGVAAARTSGIKASRGEYIIHCDPDDYVEKNWCELLLKQANIEKADITVCPYIIETRDKSLIKWPDIKENREECVLNVYKNVTWRSLCNKLIKSSLINDNNILPFKDCNVGEDWSFVIRCLNFSNKISMIDTPLYHYCIRDNSLSNNPAISDYLEPVEVFIKTSEFLDSCKNTRYERLSNYFKFMVKIRLRNQFANKKGEWFKFNSECHKSIMTFKDHTLFNRIYLRLLLSNILFYKFLMKFKKIRNSIFNEP